MKISLLVLCFFVSLFAKADNFPESLFKEDLKKIIDKVIVNLKEINPGGALEIHALGKAILIYRRTPQDIEYLSGDFKNEVVDPYNKAWKAAIRYRPTTIAAVWNKILLNTQEKYEKINDRSLLREYFIVLAYSPETTCRIYTKEKDKSSLKKKHSVFYDICTGAQYDSAGRVLKTDNGDYRNSFNLQIPPYELIDSSHIEFGLNVPKKFDHAEQIAQIDYSGMNPQEKLWLAAHNNDFKMIKESIAQGASPNKKEVLANALDYAIIGSSDEAITYLISKGAKPTTATNDMIEIIGRDSIYKLLPTTES